MKKVVNISLNGIAYQLEEPGYDELHAYLERAEARLADSPDRTEVMADLEQAIGEKCRATLGPHKTVVSASEVSNIIREMGPVESPEQKASEASGTASPHNTAAEVGFHPRKRLYRIREGQIWAGVCNGIAAYINVDVTWIRLAVALLTIFSWGGLILVYILMAFIVPYADTAEDRAAAFGMPFNTEELIKSAKKNFEEFGDRYRWRREWRRQQRHWSRQFRHMNEQLRTAAAQAGPAMGQGARFAAGIFVPIAALIGAAVFVVWILALFSLITQHTIFGWVLPHGMPLWVGILLLVLLYTAISSPLRAVRHSGQHATGGYHPAWNALHGLLWLGFTVLMFWAAYTFLPGVRELIDQLMWAANLTATTISETIV
jgi:phage shock protein PspC (stress-responsive transcriptional regulator)